MQKLANTIGNIFTQRNCELPSASRWAVDSDSWRQATTVNTDPEVGCLLHTTFI